jgi:hypothetical protein
MKRTSIEPLETRIAPATVFAVESGTNKLVTFDTSAPGMLLTDVTISGLQGGEIIAGIDFRPATGELFAIGLVDDGVARTGRIYRLDTATAAATLVGNGPFNAALADTGGYGFDFNPVVDRIRIVNSFDDSYRVNPDTGVQVAEDTDVADANASEAISGVAYTGVTGNAITTLYGINFSTDDLVLIGGVDGNPSPNAGTITPVGRIKINGVNATFSSPVGFDIAALVGGPEQGWLVGTAGGVTSLYTLDLATAAAVSLGSVGDGTRSFSGMAISRTAPAPAISADGKSATWTDIDGDAVTLKLSKGLLTPAAFTMLAGQSGSALSKLTITDAVFAGASISLTAKPGANGGDGTVNIGTIDATGRDLGSVSLAGDLSGLLAGDAVLATPGVKALTALSIAQQAEQLVGITGVVITNINGTVGSLKIAGDVSGLVFAGKMAAVLVGGDIAGKAPFFSGSIAAASVGKLVIKGNVGSKAGYGDINIDNASSITIGGNLVGNFLGDSGSIQLNSAIPTKITIGGSLIGGGGDHSAGIESTGGGALSIVIKGSVIRDSGSPGSANITVAGTTTIAIGGSVLGNEITANLGGGFLKSLTIGGNVQSDGPGTTSGISAERIGKLSIKGSIIGAANAPFSISALGSFAPANQAAALAIGSITIGGNVTYALIGAGFNFGASAIGDAAMGTVKIGGSLIASSIVAGVNPVAGKFGDADEIIQANVNTLGIVAKIASIAIGGQIYGTAGGPVDTFGIIAEQIGAITVGKVKLPFTAGKDNALVGFTGDVRVREL